MVTGGSSTEIKWNIIKDLPIPAPPSMDFDTFCADVIGEESNVQRYRELLEASEKNIQDRFRALLTGGESKVYESEAKKRRKTAIVSED